MAQVPNTAGYKAVAPDGFDVVPAGPSAEDNAADHSEVAQAAVESLSKEMRRAAKPKASRAA